MKHCSKCGRLVDNQGYHFIVDLFGSYVSLSCGPIYESTSTAEQMFLQNKTPWLDSGSFMQGVEFMQQVESNDQPFTFDELADIGDSIKEEK